MKLGQIVKSPDKGFPMKSPYLTIADQAVETMRKFLVEFGLTPSSRSRIRISGGNDPASEFDRFTESGMMVDLTQKLVDARTAGWSEVDSQRGRRKGCAHGCTFDLAAAQRVCDFFVKFLRHSKGQWAKQPFELLDWQWEWVIAPLFGWKRADGTRRYRRGYIEVPKKNGKSAMFSGLSLYLLAGDHEPGAEVYSAAVDRDQASIVFNEAANMVEASPALTGRLCGGPLHEADHVSPHALVLSGAVGRRAGQRRTQRPCGLDRRSSTPSGAATSGTRCAMPEPPGASRCC